MTPERYAALRSSLGDHRKAAKLLGCSGSAIRLRESGHLPVSADAATRLLAAVQDQAHVHAAERQGVIPGEFEACLAALGWTRREAARILLGEPQESWRISAWALGRSAIPIWISRDLRALLGLGPDDPFPTPTSTPGHRRRRFSAGCLPRDFRHALCLLKWTQQEAAERLGVANRCRVSDWSRGYRAVPLYVERHLRDLLDLGPDDPWPQRHPELVLPDFLRPCSTDAEEDR